MYHDQGQIAMKLMGFDRGVTLIGGFPFPICTPAHGTAYEIAGKGVANLGATREALLLAIRMAHDSRARRTGKRRLIRFIANDGRSQRARNINQDTGSENEC